MLLTHGTALWIRFLVVPLGFSGGVVIFLRNLGHCPPHIRLRRKGLDFLLAGHPDNAEKCFRKSMAMLDESDRIRPTVCLADALIDQGRYEESKEYLIEVLKLGDPTGSGQESMTDLLLLTRADPEKALKMATQAVELSTRAGGHIYLSQEVTNDLRFARYWARSAHAMAQLERREEARQAIDRAIDIVNSAQKIARQRKEFKVPLRTRLILGSRRLAHGRDLLIATTHWKIGLALLAMGDPSNAVEHFRITRDTDRRGKYRRLAGKQLDQLLESHL